MSTEHMTQFLEGLHASRLLENDRVEELLRRPESPQGDVDGIARFLEGQGWLTHFQVDEIRQGRGQGLMFEGYRLLEELPASATGRRFKAYHPALQQAIVICWVNREWLLPADDSSGYIERARAASALSHPNLVNVLDAGMSGETTFIVHEFVDGADLGSLVTEMGALPVALACEYARQAATALQAAHERGIIHGDLAPARLLLAPVIRKPASNGTGKAIVRPAPGAMIRLEGLGLSPRRPAVNDMPMQERLGSLQYLPPERLTSAFPDVRGDLYSLGATLYFLLAARPPIVGADPTELLRQIPRAAPPRIDTLRKDISPPLVDLINRLLAKDPAARPSGAASIVQYLQPVSASPPPGAPPSAEPVYAVPVASETDTRPNNLHAVMATVVPPIAAPFHEPLVEALPIDTRDSQVYSPVTMGGAPISDYHDPFAGDHHEQAKPRPLKPVKKVKGGWTWLILGLCLHLGAVTLLALWFLKIGPFSDSTTPAEEPKYEKQLKGKAKK